MKRVQSEEEAFVEMRRFLIANDIPSDVTYVTKKNNGVKEVCMVTESQTKPWVKSRHNIFAATFIIAPDDFDCSELGAPESYGLESWTHPLDGTPEYKYKDFLLPNETFDTTWYLCMVRYMQALREDGGG